MSTHTIKLPNGSAYILEGCLQNPGPCTTPAKIVLWAKVWDKVRKQIDRRMKVSWSADPIDFETPIFRDENETELSFKKREAEFNDAFKVWGDKEMTLTLNDKARDAVREALKYVVQHKDDERARTRVEASLSWAKLLIAFDIATDDSETDTESE
jgi:hypothetical protein